MAPQSRAFLSERERRPEIMDEPGLDPAQHAWALQGLARINRLSRSDAILWPAIERLARAGRAAPIRILDLASGGGDVPIALAKRALRAGLSVEIEGCDASALAVRFAQQLAAETGLSVRFFPLDVLNEPIPAGYDVVTCSLFLHHLAESDACSFLRKAADGARRLLLVNDLVRGPVGYLLAWTGCRLLSRSPVVRHDGPVSVAGAFTLAEARQLAENAGLAGVSLTPALAAPISFVLESLMSNPRVGESFDHVDLTTWDGIVIGAGPAGAMVARQLARGGRRVLLVEKKAFPRWKVCGACLNGQALAALRSAGLGSLVKRLGGIGLNEFRVAYRGRTARLAMPAGIALSRSRLDAALVEAATDAGALFLDETQAVVGELVDDARLVRLIHQGRSIELPARVVMVASGLGSTHHGSGSTATTRIKRGSRIGAGCLVVNGANFYEERTIFMAVGRDGYVGAVRVEDGALNVAAAFEPALVRRWGTPALAAVAIVDEAGFPPIAGLVGAHWQGTAGLTRRTWPLAEERLLRLGDAAGYVEPFTGEGIAWALVSAQAVAPLALAGMER